MVLREKSFTCGKMIFLLSDSLMCKRKLGSLDGTHRIMVKLDTEHGSGGWSLQRSVVILIGSEVQTTV